MLRAREITLQSTFEHIYQSFQTLNITTLEYTKCIRDEIQGFLVVFCLNFYLCSSADVLQNTECIH